MDQVEKIGSFGFEIIDMPSKPKLSDWVLMLHIYNCLCLKSGGFDAKD